MRRLRRHAGLSRAAVAAVVACASTLLMVMAPAAEALPSLRATPGYRFQQIDHPGAPQSTYLTSIAENGDSVGAYADAAGRYHGFVRSGATGAFTDFDVPGARDTYITGINVHGAISGTYTDPAGAQHGFVRDAKGLRTINIPGAVSTTPAVSEFGTGVGTAVAAIRDDGAIVGAWGTAAGASHGFIKVPGHRHVDIDVPGAASSLDPLFQTQGGTGVIRSNLRGDVVGYYAPSSRSSLSMVDLRAFVRRGTTFTTLLPFGALTSQAFALDEHGTVGGVAFGIDGLSGFGWLWTDGRFKRIDPGPLMALSTVADISDDGVLVGEDVTLDGRTHGYIGRPTR